MKTTYTLSLIFKGFDGTGHKQAARITLDEEGRIIERTTPIADNVIALLMAGEMEGSTELSFGVVDFTVECKMEVAG